MYVAYIYLPIKLVTFNTIVCWYIFQMYALGSHLKVIGSNQGQGHTIKNSLFVHCDY